MKKLLKIVVIIFLLSTYTTNVFATGRLVDIPVPPNSSGYTDFTEEEAAQKQGEYEKNKNNTTTAEDYIEKSSNNYLKSLSVDGYELEPEFIRENDTYTIYVKNRENVTSLNITAEADDDSAKIDGIGTVKITPKQNSINISVTAENGNLKIYKINIQNEENKENVKNIDQTQISDISIEFIVVIVIIIFIVIFISILKNRKKHK